jgi:arsenate reductase-like glutaredoxin family protein
METKGKAEKILSEIGKKIDELISRSGIDEEKVKKEFDQGMDELHKLKSQLKDDFEKFREENKGKWKEAEPKIKNAAHEIKQAIDIIFGKTDQ